MGQVQDRVATSVRPLVDVYRTADSLARPVVLWGYNRYEDIEAFTGHGARHALDSLGGGGIPGMTWNSRDAYRRTYGEDEQRGELKRMGAATGDVMGLAIASALASHWHWSGYPAFGARGIGAVAVRGAIGALLAAAIVSSGRKIVENAIDDGNLAMTLGPGGAAAAAVLAHRASGGNGFAAAAGLALGGVAGYFVGKRIRTGDGHIGQPAPDSYAPRLDGRLAPLAFARGAWNHFAEEGPLTQGVTFGRDWGQRQRVRAQYTDPEVTGAMTGSLAAAGLMGTGGLAVVLRTMGKGDARVLQTRIGRISDGLSLPSRVIGYVRRIEHAHQLLGLTPVERARELERIASKYGHVGMRKQEHFLRVAEKLKNHRGRFPELLWLASGAALGYTLYEAYNGARGSKVGVPGPLPSLGIAGAGIAATSAALLKFSDPLRGLPARLRIPIAIGTASILFTGLIMVRGSSEQFVADSVELHRRRPANDLALAGALGVGGAAIGSLVGLAAGRGIGLPGGARLGIALGAVAGAGVGYAYSPLIAHRKEPPVRPTGAAE